MRQHELELREAISLVFPSMGKLRRKAICDYYFSANSQTRKIGHHHSGTEFVTCLVASHTRHNLTDYEAWFPQGYHTPLLKPLARKAVQPVIDYYLEKWSH